MATKTPIANYSGELKEIQSGDTIPAAIIPSLSGTYQPLDSDLTTLAANITAFGHSLVDDANAAAAQSTLGLLGANDRVLYQAGGVVSQSANLTHNGTSLGVGGPTIGTINGNSFATVRGHFRSTGGGYLAMDSAGASGLLLNDSTQSANSRLWSILSNSAVLSFATMTDAGVATNRWTLNRSGQTVIGSGSVINAEILNVRGAGGTSYTNADFVVSNSTVAGKGIFMQFDNTNDVGRIQAANYGVAFKDLWLQGQGGNLKLGDACNLILGTSTGNKIGTATSQKLGFWNVTPVVQPSGWSVTHSPSQLRTFDYTTMTGDELIRFVVTLMDDLKLMGILGA